MKKFIAVLITSAFLVSPAYCASQWTVGDPQGTESSGTIDNIMRINQAAQDRLLYNYRYGATVVPNSVSSVDVLAGNLSLPNSAGTVVRYGHNTTTVNVPWSVLDTGSEESSKTYYVWAVLDADATTFTIKTSLSSSAPASSTYYRKLGRFYNNASSSIENVTSFRNDDGNKHRDIIDGWVNYNGVSNTINNSYNVSSVTDNGTGDYSINWTTAFANANYAVAGASGFSDLSKHTWRMSAISTTSVRIYNTNVNSTAQDIDPITVIAIGD